MKESCINCTKAGSVDYDGVLAERVYCLKLKVGFSSDSKCDHYVKKRKKKNSLIIAKSR
ncbi:hypothetical protein [Aquimarina spongiae]|uniref:Uncharacterized protein n=1 Tax=Aquimarina spongiae TaxID=570521 RepID=A0A1M6C8Y8_9FLAO|nr:hypothetical protein [Aquimarina spongiae]SHI57469.1 hypothetical protein SAMN04488508_1024 [Aquimarina spongiae]